MGIPLESAQSSSDNNFDVKIRTKFPKKTLKLKICTGTTVSIYSGNRVGIIIGAKVIPKIVIIIESATAYFLTFSVSFPAESNGKINLKIIDENIIITAMNCNARE